MFARSAIIIGILGIIAGVVITMASAIPAIGTVIASPFCKEVEESNFGNTLTCINGEQEQNLTEVFAGVGSAVIIGGALLLVFSIVGALMFMSAKLNRIIRTGEAAQATILAMQSTGVRVNSQPMLKFRLRVQPSYGEAYEAETNRIIPFGMMGHLGIGMVVPVKYDPNKPEDVALDMQAIQLSAIPFGTGAFSTPNPAPQTSLTDKLRELEESLEAGLISQEEYEDARKRIISKFLMPGFSLAVKDIFPNKEA